MRDKFVFYYPGGETKVADGNAFPSDASARRYAQSTGAMAGFWEKDEQLKQFFPLQDKDPTRVFDEHKLRDEIVKIWGPAGAHVEVFDMMYNRIKELEALMGGD